MQLRTIHMPAYWKDTRWILEGHQKGSKFLQHRNSCMPERNQEHIVRGHNSISAGLDPWAACIVAKPMIIDEGVIE